MRLVVIIALLLAIVIAYLIAQAIKEWRANRVHIEIGSVKDDSSVNGVYLVQGKQRTLVSAAPMGDDIALDEALLDAHRMKKSLARGR